MKNLLLLELDKIEKVWYSRMVAKVIGITMGDYPMVLLVYFGLSPDAFKGG